MPVYQILRGPFATSLWLVGAALASCVMLGTFVWITERTASEARLLAEVQHQGAVLQDVIESGRGIVTLLLQHPDVRTLFSDYNGYSPQSGVPNELIHTVLDEWLLRSTTISGVIIRATDGRILGKAGISLATAGEPDAAAFPAPAADVILHIISRTGQVALTASVNSGIQRAAGAITLLLSDSAISFPAWERKSRWQSTRYSLLARSADLGWRLFHPAIDDATKQEMLALDLQSPGLFHAGGMVVAWSGIADYPAGVIGLVDADEFSRAAAGTALLVTSGAAAVFLLAGLLVMLRSRQSTRRLGKELVQLRRELESQIREEQALLATTAQMSTAAHLAAIGHWVTQRTDSGWVWTAATPEIARIYGVPRRRLIGGIGFSRHVVHPEDQARMHAIWDEVNRNPRRYEAEFRLVQPSGEVRHVVEVGEPVFDQHGLLTNFRGTMQDITEYRHSESVVSEAEARLRQTPMSATVCHWVSYENQADASDSRYTYSRSAVNLFGVPPEQLPLSLDDMARFIHPDDVARVTDHYRQSGLSPAAYCICYRLLRPDGSVLWVEETSEPAFAPGGGLTHTFGTMTEIPAPPASQ